MSCFLNPPLITFLNPPLITFLNSPLITFLNLPLITSEGVFCLFTSSLQADARAGRRDGGLRGVREIEVWEEVVRPRLDCRQRAADVRLRHIHLTGPPAACERM